MSQNCRPSVAARSISQDLLARVTAVEEALRLLEHQVRDVNRQPGDPFERSIDRAGWLDREPEERRCPALVVEIAA